MELFHINRWWRVRLSVAENPGSPFEGLIPPGLDDICAASPASAVSPLTAASATFALKAGLCGSDVVVSRWYLLFPASCRSQGDNPLIPAVQIPPASSLGLPFGFDAAPPRL